MATDTLLLFYTVEEIEGTSYKTKVPRVKYLRLPFSDFHQLSLNVFIYKYDVLYRRAHNIILII